MTRVLLVEDKDSLRETLRVTLEKEGYQVDAVSDGRVAAELLHERRFQLLLTDLRLPGESGLDLLKAARDNDPAIEVIVMTAYGSISEAVSAMRLGAFDFLAKPVEIDHLLLLMKRALERNRLYAENLLLREEFAKTLGFPVIVGDSQAMQVVSQAIQRVAGTDSTVLLFGESGTGKELFARAIHHLSPRRECPFVAINCAAIPETLLENELFGHEKGAFTGATSRKAGKFELADHGTIFLDEIGDLGLTLQAKLLRVIQERSFERIGGLAVIETDVRLIVATNRDLQDAVAEKRFREDLYYRISTFPVQIPPLRERPGDIPLLANHFLLLLAQTIRRRAMRLDPAAIEKLQHYGWPGNVREIRNCIERAVILCDGDVIRPADLVFSGGPLEEEVNWGGGLEEIEKDATRWAARKAIRNAMAAAHGDLAGAAAILKLSDRKLETRIKELGMGGLLRGRQVR
ncbi:MAG: sigma-54 dependent transcriptional regulator [Acidobacteriota bacterium]